MAKGRPRLFPFILFTLRLHTQSFSKTEESAEGWDAQLYISTHLLPSRLFHLPLTQEKLTPTSQPSYQPSVILKVREVEAPSG